MERKSHPFFFALLVASLSALNFNKVVLIFRRLAICSVFHFDFFFVFFPSLRLCSRSKRAAFCSTFRTVYVTLTALFEELYSCFKLYNISQLEHLKSPRFCKVNPNEIPIYGYSTECQITKLVANKFPLQKSPDKFSLPSPPGMTPHTGVPRRKIYRFPHFFVRFAANSHLRNRPGSPGTYNNDRKMEGQKRKKEKRKTIFRSRNCLCQIIPT